MMSAAKNLDERVLEEQRMNRVSEILAGGLVRLNHRGTLAIRDGDDANAGETSLPISTDSPASRLEASAESGLTVHDG
ncbi:hypothetical protein Poly51_61360 [Rubripirellula tenax]|uniref:Uncharacterized protein n=2 Tax=Rubripirellula tenax TaxID=2528015 RepID=A0A5C6E6M8_9BACT|nr:hypothetical protein Poly51_61360 [Rubripirellula tenax]